MPAATVTSRTSGSVSFQFAHDAGASAYRIYSSSSGPNVDSLITKVLDSVPNPSPVGGQSKFTFTDSQLGILDASKDWWIRVVTLVSGVETPIMLSTPGTKVPLLVSGQNSLKQKTVSANFDGVTSGVFNFENDEQIDIVRILLSLSPSSAYTVAILDADGDSTIIATGSGTSLSFTTETPLDPGEVVTVITATPGNHMAKVTKKA